METSIERRFYGALGAVPEVPPEVFTRVERAARRPNVLLRTALAACLALAVAIPALVIAIPGTQRHAYAYANDNDFFDDLLDAFEYLSGKMDDDDDMFIDSQISRLSEGGF